MHPWSCPGRGRLQYCFSQRSGPQVRDFLVLGVGHHVGESQARRVANDEYRVPCLATLGDHGGRSVARVNHLRAILLGEWPEFAHVSDVLVALTAGEAE